MPRRMLGDPTVEPWPGSSEEREELRVRAERDRKMRERVSAALRLADFPAAEACGYEPAAVRRLAQINAETGGDVEDIANRLNLEGHVPAAGQEWEGFAVAACISTLWPHTDHDRWPDEYGMYPGYLGGLRDRLMLTSPFEAIGPRRHQYSCSRCGALWPTGWPDADPPDLSELHCPDCRVPGGSVGGVEDEREHSIIDMHWLMFRYAPYPVGPCPVCGSARELVARGYFGIKERVLYWSCGAADEIGTRGRTDSHYMKSLARAAWASTAALYAYWLAVDMLRLAEQAGEVTELPIGAEYEALDGSGERWVYLASGWERC
jgi:DNA-directed RNA polymerase subunit RPC12/RpoP